MKTYFFNTLMFRQVVLLSLLMLAIFFASTGGFQDPQWSELFKNIACSVLAAVVSVYFLQGLEKKNEVDLDQIIPILNRNLSRVNPNHFVCADRNMDMGDKYWVGLIENLGTSNEDAAFVGSRLSWWLKTGSYKEPLRIKISERLRNLLIRYKNSNSNFKTYVFLTNPDWIPQWEEFFEKMINEVLTAHPQKKELKSYLWNHIIIGLLPREKMKYSLVLCDDRLAITYYTSKGRSEDSPTIEINKNSIMRNLYLEDIDMLIKEAEYGEKEET